MDQARALKVGQRFIGDNILKVVKYRKVGQGDRGWRFGVFVASDGKVVEVTNYVAIALGFPCTESQETQNWEARANPGYDLQTFVNESWLQAVGG
jgi:hypothetical protein